MLVCVRFSSKLEHHSICAMSLMQLDLSTGKDIAPLASCHAVQSGLSWPQLTRIQALVAAHMLTACSGWYTLSYPLLKWANRLRLCEAWLFVSAEQTTIYYIGFVAAGSSAPSGYSGSAFTNVPVLGSLPAHAVDVNRSVPGETALFTGQVLLPVMT